MSTTLRVTGMTCDGCEDIVETALEMADGVDTATADQEAQEATVEGDASVETLIEKVRLAGYEAEAA
ncbi:heavy-metal-associated domain-containing protein [Halorubellus sp. JP-L1]|uniref:heavy-metal-associated domain-containing protein n=1 Tax=Halorubellus sp. JP-L1 TaxID=2715753 RepID=UPI00140C3240|nr:heavy metal-associated domain-containing protein [Halorubellus sp. JP-L1]NHN40385.1 heavy-metal-associated domain-containing protein [Halorubellus sp. JP-L1]